MQKVVGVGPAEKLLQFAIMATPDEAKELGLVDDVVPRQKLQTAAEAAIMELLKAPDAGRAVRKFPFFIFFSPGSFLDISFMIYIRMKCFTQVSSFPLQETKRLLRGELAAQWQAFLPQESEYAWRQLNSPATVAKLKEVMQRLAGKKKPSATTAAGPQSKL